MKERKEYDVCFRKSKRFDLLVKFFSHGTSSTECVSVRVCMYLRMCVKERERERERGGGERDKTKLKNGRI